MSKTDQTLKLAQERGIVRPRDLKAHGIPGTYLNRLAARGLLVRIDRGLYALPNYTVTEFHSLAEATRRVPAGVVCLLSALRFHGLTTQNPFEVWLALDAMARVPKSSGLALRIVRLSGASLGSFVEEHVIEGVPVRVYSAAKTVADCFKFRNKIGLDVALEALRDCWQQRKATMDEFWEAAKADRVANVMRPYIESLV